MAFAVSAPLLAIGVLLFVVDPEGGHESWSTSELHDYREVGNRRGRARLLLRGDFEAAVLGSSRVSLGLDTDAQSLVEGRTANVGLMDTNLWELLRVADFILQRTEIEAIAFCVDLHCLASTRRTNGDFERSEFAPNAAWNRFTDFEAEAAELLSYRELTRSLECLERLIRDGRRYGSNGVDRRVLPPDFADREQAKQHLLQIYLANPATYLGFVYGEDRMRDLEAFLGRAAAKGVRVVLAIPPMHALQLECIQQLGLWPHLRRLKTDLAEIGARQNCPVVDFAAHHEFAVEPMPTEDHPEAEMAWWFETSHFTPRLGAAVIERLAASLAGREADRELFGHDLRPSSLEAHLANCERARDAWRAANPSESEWIAGILHGRELLWLKPPPTKH